MAYNRDKDIKGYDPEDEAALAFLAKGAKEHPQLRKHLLDCANKIHEGVFTDVNIDYTDNATGKKRLARIDKDDASQMLADQKRMDEFAKKKAILQAEWKKIEEAERQA